MTWEVKANDKDGTMLVEAIDHEKDGGVYSVLFFRGGQPGAIQKLAEEYAAFKNQQPARQ